MPEKPVKIAKEIGFAYVEIHLQNNNKKIKI